MIIIKLFLGLVIILGLIIMGIISIGVIAWFCSFIDSKTRGTMIEKILNFIGKIINWIFWILFWALVAVIFVGAAYNIGCDIIK